METEKTDTVVQQLTKATEASKASNIALEAKTTELKNAVDEMAKQKIAVDVFEKKIKASDAEIVTLKASDVEKDKKIAELEAKITLIPALEDIAEGTVAVKDASTDKEVEKEVDHAEIYKAMTDAKEAGIYFQAHEAEIIATLG